MNFTKVAANEELCAWYGKSYASARDYVAKKFQPDAEYRAIVNLTRDLMQHPRAIPVTYTVAGGNVLPQRRPREDEQWDFRASFLVDGKQLWFNGRVTGVNKAWVNTEFEDGETKAYRLNLNLSRTSMARIRTFSGFRARRHQLETPVFEATRRAGPSCEPPTSVAPRPIELRVAWRSPAPRT